VSANDQTARQEGDALPLDVQIQTQRYAIFRLLRANASHDRLRAEWSKLETLMDTPASPAAAPAEPSDEISDNGAPQPRGEPVQTNATQPTGSPNIAPPPSDAVRSALVERLRKAADDFEACRQHHANAEGGGDEPHWSAQQEMAEASKAAKDAADFLSTPAGGVTGVPKSLHDFSHDGYCSPAGPESCLHSRPRNRCKDCPVADDPTVTEFPVVAAEPVAWQKRLAKPADGSWTEWKECSIRDIEWLKKAVDSHLYETRPLYAAPPVRDRE
jgi:hypothetical protein